MSSVLWLVQSKSLRNGSCYHYYKDDNDNNDKTTHIYLILKSAGLCAGHFSALLQVSSTKVQQLHTIIDSQFAILSKT